MKRTIGIASAAMVIALAMAAGAGAAESKGAAVTVTPKTVAAKTGHVKSVATTAASRREVEGSYTVQVVDLNQFVTEGVKATPVSVSSGGSAREPQYGLLMDGVLYVPLMKDMGSPVKPLSEHLGKSVTVRGVKEVRSSEHFLILTSVGAPVSVNKS